MLINSIGSKVGIALITCFPLLCSASGPCAEGAARADAPAPASSQVIIRAERPWQSEPAVKAAIADGVTTGVAIAAGAVEMNPLVNPSPLGLVMLTAAKVGLVKYAADLPENDKRLVMKTTTAAWGGAAVNNLLVLVAAPPPFPLLAGLAMAVIGWRHMTRDYDEQDRIAALQASQGAADKLVECVAPAPQGQEVALAR